MKFTAIKKIFMLVLFAAFCLGSCKNDDAPIDPIGNQGTVTVGTLYGRVIDIDGNAISRAKVTVGSEEVYSDPQGFYFFRAKSLAERASISAEKGGYFKNASVAYLSENSELRTDIVLSKKEQNFAYDNASGGTHTSANGIEFSFPENAVVTPDGRPHIGQVVVQYKYLDPTEEESFARMPGELIGRVTADGAPVFMETQGMIAVELEGTAGTPLKVASGKMVDIALPVNGTTNAPASIPIWSFNTETGYWMQEGSADAVGGKYRMSVGHFTWWNCDDILDGELIDISGRLVTDGGDPIAGMSFYPRIGSQASGFATTDENGRFKGTMLKDVPFKFKFSSLSSKVCGGTLLNSELNFDALSSDTDLGDVPLALISSGGKKEPTNIKARIVDCTGRPYTDGYLLINNKTIVRADAQGYINSTELLCSAGDGLVIPFARSGARRGDDLIFKAGTTQDFGNLVICFASNNSQYFSHTINGAATFMDHTSYFTTSYTPDNNLSSVQVSNGSDNVSMEWNGNARGVFQVNNMQLEGVDYSFPSTDVEVTLTSYGLNSGDTWLATYFGFRAPQNGGSPDTLSGTFLIDRQ